MAMNKQMYWLRNNRALFGAIVVTVALGLLIFTGKMLPGRAAIPLSICWVLALHSLDLNDHKEEVIKASTDLARAGLAFRAGHGEQCVEDLQRAEVEVEQVVDELRSKCAGAEKA